VDVVARAHNSGCSESLVCSINRYTAPSSLNLPEFERDCVRTSGISSGSTRIEFSHCFTGRRSDRRSIRSSPVGAYRRTAASSNPS
jgi:hypothetical protein